MLVVKVMAKSVSKISKALHIQRIVDIAFTAAGPVVWNSLPTDLRQPDLSHSRFRQSLKMKTFYLVSGTKAQCKL